MVDAISSSLEATMEAANISMESIQPRLDELRQAAEDFEAIFLHQLLKIMKQASPEGGLFEASFARDVYEDMMNEQLATEMAENGSFGLADLLYEDTKELAIAEAITEYTTSKAE